jgi:hypothetical protein
MPPTRDERSEEPPPRRARPPRDEIFEALGETRARELERGEGCTESVSASSAVPWAGIPPESGLPSPTGAAVPDPQ